MGRFSGRKRGVPRGPVATATGRPAATRESCLREAALRLELFAAAAAAASLFVLLVFLIFLSVFVGYGRLHQPLSQNC